MVCVSTPTLSVRPPARPRATGLGRKPSVRIASSMASRFSGLTVAVPLRMRDTVLGDTPAALATIPSVTVPEADELDAVLGERLRRTGGWFIEEGSDCRAIPAV